MDWEIYERYRSTLLLAGLLLVSALLFAFQKASSVQHLRAFLVRFAQPPQQFMTQLKMPKAPKALDQGSAEKPFSPDEVPVNGRIPGEERRKVQVLSEKIVRLREILDLKKGKWPRAIVAHVAGGDRHRWL